MIEPFIKQFTSEFLEEVFVRPARLQALKAKKKIKCRF